MVTKEQKENDERVAELLNELDLNLVDYLDMSGEELIKNLNRDKRKLEDLGIQIKQEHDRQTTKINIPVSGSCIKDVMEYYEHICYLMKEAKKAA